MAYMSVDKSMIPYFEKHSAKQFIRSKPIMFGFKVLCLNSRLGYLILCDQYQGKGTYLDQQFGLGSSVVWYLVYMILFIFSLGAVFSTVSFLLIGVFPVFVVHGK